MISGGLDYHLKIYDFDTMNQNLRPFKDFKPFDGHPVTALSWCPSSSHFLVCCPNNQARIYSFDGVKKQTTVRGDMYLHDMANTKGHIAAILDGKWHPKNDNLFLTSSSDGTIRQWDLNSKPVGMD
jgi:WD40 repeat protein